MKTKLIKVEEGYLLIDVNNSNDDRLSVIASYPFNEDVEKLSLKNCQAVENGYDVIDLAERNSKYNEEDWISGFLFAINLMSDKKFSEYQVRKALSMSRDRSRGEFIHSFQTILDAVGLMQQTGWDVEIETIEYGLGNDEAGRPVFETRFLLDKDGCLILKRK